MWKKCAALPKNTLFIRGGCGAERLQQSVDTSQHIGRRFYLIKYTQNGSCPRGGRRIDDSVQTLGKKTLSYIKLGGAHQEIPWRKRSWKTRWRGGTQEVHKRFQNSLTVYFFIWTSDSIGGLLGCSAQRGPECCRSVVHFWRKTNLVFIRAVEVNVNVNTLITR